MTEAAHGPAERIGLLISVAASLTVGCGGVVFYFLTGAEAILLDGLFNLTYFATGLFTLRVARLIDRGDDELFPVGYSFFEPLVNGSKGVLMLGVTLLALVGAVEALFTGGREIALGQAVIYGMLASCVCWIAALLIRKQAGMTDSPLVAADAASWVINAAISSAVLVTLAVVFLIRNTSWRGVIPYVDPLLVLLVCSVTIGVPIRMAWSALMELLNRTPSHELLARVRHLIAESLGDLPVEQCTVRVLQPGRTRIVSAHILLPANFRVTLDELDEVRERTHDALTSESPASQVDLLFTRDPRWSAPLNGAD